MVKNCRAEDIHVTPCMPQRVQSLSLKRQDMHGTLLTDRISRDLHRLDLYDNFLAGEIAWISLPPPLELLILDENYFTGSIDLRHLPKHLHTLGLSSNRFSGSIDVRNLPRCLRRMYLNDNSIKQPIIEVNNIPTVAECYIFTENDIGRMVNSGASNMNALFF